MATAPLPREIVKWLQSLDLSFSVKNPKRDFTNGYLVAEIMSRYHPKDVDILTYENGSRLEAKLDNWEQLFKLFKKKNVGISKAEFDPVIHCAPGAAILFCHKLYAELTKCQVKVHGPIQELMSKEHEKPPFMRDTASRRLKNEEINRIQDNVERTIVAIDALGYYHQERRQLKAVEAPGLILQERRLRMGLSQEESKQEEQMESVQIDEVKVKALQGGEKQMRGETQKQDLPPAVKATGSKIALLKAVTNRNTSVGALASFQYPTLFVKPAMDIMRPLVFKIVEESEELSKMIDSRNQDIVVSFMEQCREGVRDVVGRDSKGDGNRAPPPPVEQRMREIEETSVRVFETLAKRAELLVESLTKSPPEFWKVWNTFYPALTDFSESSPIFESAVFFFKTLGELMRKQEPALTQQLMLEVALPSMAKELARAPEKRDSLCEILYSFTQEDTYNHLLALRALKDKVGDNLPVYVSCLASLISIDASRDLLYDEHLLDLYVYYALVAIQSAQPRIRVAGISILYTITRHSSQHQSVAALIHSFSALAADDWWEVQAQLLRLAAHLLMKLSGERQDTAHSGADDDEGSASATSKAGDAADGESTTDQLLGIINRLFVVSNSKNVLQVGLSSLVHLLPEYPTLLPMFVTVLLEQRPILRQRLLELPPEGQERPRRTYVRGNFTCMYEETCLPQIWPHLDVARTLAMQLEASPLDHFEVEHMEVLLASLPEQFEVVEAEEWLHVFEKVKQYIFIALVDPQLHLYSTQIIKKFWVCPVEKIATGSIEASKRTLEQALRVLYSPGSEERVEEAAVLVFLRELRNRGGEVQIEVEGVVELFKQKYPDEYAASQLDTIFDD